MSFDERDIMDIGNMLSVSMDRIANSITTPAGPGTDATGVQIESLTEAVMGVTSGLCKIAWAIEELADAVRFANANSIEKVDP